MIDDSIESFYNMNFELSIEKHYSLTEIENMLPFEREIFFYMTVRRVQERAEEVQNG